MSGRVRTGGLAPAGEELARGAAGPEGLELRELPSPYAEDEISLVDLSLVLVRRRFIIVATVLACILAGFLFAHLRSPLYVFTTTIQIGQIIKSFGPDDSPAMPEALESTESVIVKLNAGYIPEVLAAYLDEADDRTAPKIEASSPKELQIVLIKSKAPEKESELHVNLHKKIMKILLVDHTNLSGYFRNLLEFKLTQAQSEYERLLDETRTLANRFKLLDATKALLERQIGEIQDLLSSTVSGLERALSEVSDDTKALTFMIVGNEIQQNRARLANLEERLHVGLPQERSTLEKQLADVKRAAITQQNRIATIEVRWWNSLRETRLLVEPVSSLDPVGLSRAAILALAGVFGLIFGVIAAFFAEFLSKIRAAMAEAQAAREPVVSGG